MTMAHANAPMHMFAARLLTSSYTAWNVSAELCFVSLPPRPSSDLPPLFRGSPGSDCTELVEWLRPRPLMALVVPVPWTCNRGNFSKERLRRCALCGYIDSCVVLGFTRLPPSRKVPVLRSFSRFQVPRDPCVSFGAFVVQACGYFEHAVRVRACMRARIHTQGFGRCSPHR